MDWNKLGNNIVKGVQKANEVIEKKAEDHKREMRNKLRTMSDRQVIHATENATADYLKDLAKEEADRRGLDY